MVDQAACAAPPMPPAPEAPDAPRCPFIPPYPTPLKSKAGLGRRFLIAWNSWIHTLFDKSYTMKMGTVALPALRFHVLNDLAEATRLLDDAERVYPKHRVLNDLLDPLLGNSVFSANGHDWAMQREMVNPAFAHTNLARAFALMAQAVDDLVALIRAEDLSRPVDIDPLMTHVTADIIFRTILSLKLDRAESARVYAAFNRYQAHAQRSTTLGLYGLPRLWFAGAARRAAARVHAVFAPIIRVRHEAYRAGARLENPDILEALMNARHPETGQPFDFQALVDQASIIFLAGHETSASALSWALYLLSESPDLQRELHAAIEVATGNGPITHEALRGMDGVRNLFRETLRLYPPVGFLPREITRAETLRGKALAPGEMVVMAPWLIHRNPANWACPHAFDPYRFAGRANAEAIRNAWLPFGRGPRICVGAGFAQQEAMLVLARLIREFTLAYPPGPRPEVISRLTLRPRRGIPLILVPRSGTGRP